MNKRKEPGMFTKLIIGYVIYGIILAISLWAIAAALGVALSIFKWVYIGLTRVSYSTIFALF